MADAEVRIDLVLVCSEETATIHAAIDKVNIADWVLDLPMGSTNAARRRITLLRGRHRPMTGSRYRSTSRWPAAAW